MHLFLRAMIRAAAVAMVAATLTAAKPQVCESEADYTPDVVASFHCESDKGAYNQSACEAKGGEFQDGDKCTMDMHGLDNDNARKAQCDKIGGAATQITCGMMVSSGWVADITSKDQCEATNPITKMTNKQSLAYLGGKCCGGKKYNPICGGAPKVCETDSDYTPDATASFNCEVKGLDKTACEAKGGEHKDEDGGKCEMGVNGLPDGTARQSKCDKIGGAVTQTTCGMVVAYGYVPSITSKDQCDKTNPLNNQTNKWALEYLGGRCCGGKKQNQICSGTPKGGAPKVCDADGDFKPGASSMMPGDAGNAPPTCEKFIEFMGSSLPRSSSECGQNIPTMGPVTKSGALTFLAYHCCKTSSGGQGKANKVCPQPKSLCGGGWADFTDAVYRYECSGMQPATDNATCTALGGVWDANKKDCEDEDSNKEACAKAKGTLQPVYCSQNGILLGLDVAGMDAKQCAAPPVPESPYPLSWYMNKMAGVCCSSKAAAACAPASKSTDRGTDKGAQTTAAAGATLSVNDATAARDVADKAFKAAGCDTNANKTGCDTLKATKDAAEAGLRKAQNAQTPAQTTAAAGATLSVSDATATRDAADKAFKAAGCDTDANKAGCDKLKATKDAAEAELKKAEDAANSAGATFVASSASSAAVLVAAAVAVF